MLFGLWCRAGLPGSASWLEQPRQQLVKSLSKPLQEAILKELPRLERFLSTISVLAAVAPLLGLLGTVSGMINTFQAITIHGTGDPRMLSGGISEALITTQLGLLVAVPVLILHHFLERRVDARVGEMEEKSTALTVIMLKHRGIHSGMVDRSSLSCHGKPWNCCGPAGRSSSPSLAYLFACGF